uniref:Uncharacterized protein n=1 Tax=Arundo donax TaxID=35708 RepID=A0A0A9EAS0_ARUDO
MMHSQDHFKNGQTC